MHRWVRIIIGLLCFCGLSAQAAEITVQVNIPECKMRVNYDDHLLYEAPVGIGRSDSQTPIGNFTIINKVIDPTWYPEGREPILPGPNNPIGKYWLGLSKKGYGLHGNINSSSIGNPVSSGCVRMDNEDVEILFYLVDIGTKVEIVYQTLFLMEDENGPKLGLIPDIYQYGSNSISAFWNLVKDKHLKQLIFVPYLMHLIEEEEAGIYSIPLKVTVYYGCQPYYNLAFKLDSIIYLDPRGIPELIEEESKLREFLKDYPDKYVSYEDFQQNLSRERMLYLVEDVLYIQNSRPHLQNIIGRE